MDTSLPSIIRLILPSTEAMLAIAVAKVAAAAAAAVAAVAAALHSNHIAVYAENFSRHATSSDQLDSCMQTHALPCSADYQFRPNYEQ
ncbi:Outer membrane porin protein LC [Dirofilaria immitis]